MKLGDLSSTQGSKDNLGESSEGEHSEEVKKPRLGENEDRTFNSEELTEGNVGNKDHTEGLKEEDTESLKEDDAEGLKEEDTKGLKEKDEILRVLSDMHEEVKKPSLGESSETNEEYDNTEILEVEDAMVEDKTNLSEDLEDEIMGDEDNTNTEGLKEEDKISGVLLNQHEVVPLEDPGPHVANEDGVEGLRCQPSNV